MTKEFLGFHSTLAHHKTADGMEHFREATQAFIISLGVALHLYRRYAVALADDIIDLVIAIAPIIHIISVLESLTDYIRSNGRLEHAAPLATVRQSRLYALTIIYTAQSIVVNLELRRTGTAAGMVYGEFLKTGYQAAIAQKIEIT